MILLLGVIVASILLLKLFINNTSSRYPKKMDCAEMMRPLIERDDEELI